MKLYVRTYDGKDIGTISLSGKTLISSPSVKEISDSTLAGNDGNALKAFAELAGYQNGYLYATTVRRANASYSR